MNPVHYRVQHHRDSADFNPQRAISSRGFKAADGTYERYIEVNAPQWGENRSRYQASELKKGRVPDGFLYISRDPLHFPSPSAPIFNFS